MIRRLSLDSAVIRVSAADLFPFPDLPQAGPLTRLRVATWSMFPTLQKGDVLEVEEAHEIRPGDIVVFRRGHTLICHRVIGCGRNGEILAAGDQAPGHGEAVPVIDVLAKVRAITRRGKCLVPGPPALPTATARLRLSMDRSLLAWHTAWRHLAERVWHRLCQSPRGLAVLSWLIRRGARMHVVSRSRLRSLGATPVVCRDTIRLHEVGRMGLACAASATECVRLEIRLGPYLLGACDPASGEIAVQRQVKDLGLEQVFRKLIQNRKVQSKSKDEPAETPLSPGSEPV